MNEIGEMELKFAELIWPRAPIGSGELVALCENNFGGSLPGFLAAFTKKVKLSDKDIAELEELIRSNRRK